MNGGVEGSVSEPVRIIEILKKKADSMKGGGALGSNTGSKRKHDEIRNETDQLLAGFQLPYVGAAVASVSSVPGPESSSLHPSSSFPEFRNGTPSHSARPRLGTPHSLTPTNSGSESGRAKSTTTSESERNKCKEKGKKMPYPTVGIRVRPGREGPPAIRLRERAPSAASTSTSSVPDSDTRMQPLRTSQPSSLPPTPAPPNPYPFVLQPNQEAAGMYQAPLSTGPMHPPMQPAPMLSPSTDYPPSFNDVDHADTNVRGHRARKFSIHNSGPHQYPIPSPPHLILDQNQSNTYGNVASPVTFHPSSSAQSSTGGLSFGGSAGLASLSSPSYGSGLPAHNPSS